MITYIEENSDNSHLQVCYDAAEYTMGADITRSNISWYYVQRYNDSNRTEISYELT